MFFCVAKLQVAKLPSSFLFVLSCCRRLSFACRLFLSHSVTLSHVRVEWIWSGLRVRDRSSFRNPVRNPVRIGM